MANAAGDEANDKAAEGCDPRPIAEIAAFHIAQTLIASATPAAGQGNGTGPTTAFPG
jgi:hypothetical protein